MNEMKKDISEAALIEYQREFSRRDRLDTKAIGYITIVSIILATSVALYALIVPNNERIYLRFFSFLAFLGVCYFSIWTLIFSLISQRMVDLGNLHLDELERLWENNIEYQRISIFLTVKKITKKNIDITNNLVYYNWMIFVFLAITVGFFASHFIVSFISIMGEI